MSRTTDVHQFIGELGAGVLEEQLAHAISDVATQVVALDKVGEVTLKLKFKKTGSNDQVGIAHTLTYLRPKRRGSTKEDETQDTIMYVNNDCSVTIFPASQMDMINNGNVNAERQQNAD